MGSERLVELLKQVVEEMRARGIPTPGGFECQAGGVKVSVMLKPVEEREVTNGQ